MPMTGSTRRRFVTRSGAAASAALVATGTRSGEAAAQAGGGAGATFVLVHGAWHGGWCYERVAERLRGRGHRVFTPTLTGLGERSHLLDGGINLTTHIEDVANVIRWQDLREVVLCGHSYGGMVVTGVADRLPGTIASLVYLDAFIAEDGRSVFDLNDPATVQIQTDAAATHGGFAIPPVPAGAFNVNPADRAWVDAKCTPHPIGTFLERIRLSGSHQAVRKQTYIYAAGWQGTPFTPIYERAKADPAWTAVSLPCGHDVMVDMPDRLTELLEHAAA